MHFFVFPSVNVLVRKTQLFHFPPLHILTRRQPTKSILVKLSSLAPTHNSVDNWAQLTQKLHSIPLPQHFPTTHVKQREMEKFLLPKASDFLLLSLCARSTKRILMTLTLNENEVTINYIKYDISFSAFLSLPFFGATILNIIQVYLNVKLFACIHLTFPCLWTYFQFILTREWRNDRRKRNEQTNPLIIVKNKGNPDDYGTWKNHPWPNVIIS